MDNETLRDNIEARIAIVRKIKWFREQRGLETRGQAKELQRLQELLGEVIERIPLF